MLGVVELDGVTLGVAVMEAEGLPVTEAVGEKEIELEGVVVTVFEMLGVALFEEVTEGVALLDGVGSETHTRLACTPVHPSVAPLGGNDAIAICSLVPAAPPATEAVNATFV